MTTIDFADLPAVRPPALPQQRRPFAALRTWYAGFRLRREERLTLVELSRLDAHLLRDLGINPMDVRDAYTGRSSSILFDPIRPYDRE